MRLLLEQLDIGHMWKTPTTQFCYLDSSTSDKPFNTFRSRRTYNKEVIDFVIEKQVGVTSMGYKYKLETYKDDISTGEHIRPNTDTRQHGGRIHSRKWK